MYQLYARIKRSSKYYYSQHNPEQPLFPVSLSSIKTAGDYCVHGGPGSQYRKSDVALYVKVDDDQEIRLW